jgi:hypothetical protein
VREETRGSDSWARRLTMPRRAGILPGDLTGILPVIARSNGPGARALQNLPEFSLPQNLPLGMARREPRPTALRQ